MSAQPPSPAPTRNESFVACMAGELVNNFVGDKNLTGVTLAVNLAAVLGKQGVGALLPGPGWLYTATAVAWNTAQGVKAYMTCK